MNKSVKILIGLAILAVVLLVLSQVYKKSDKLVINNTDEYINLSGDKIPSIYGLLGEKNLTEVSSGTDTTGSYVLLTYNDLSLVEAGNYLFYLGEDGYVLIDANDYDGTIAIEAKDTSKILSVTLTYDNGTTTIKYSKGKGTITRTEK